MSIRTPATVVAFSLISLAACGGGAEAPKDPSSPPSKDAPASPTASGKDAACKKPSIGNKAPDLSINSMNGAGKAAIASGKVTLVDFWATWCEPCKKSFPKYQELYVKYKASGLEIIAVSVDDEKGEVPGFAKNYGAKFPVGWDDGHKNAGCWSPPGMPSAFIIDKQGVVKHIHQGWHDGEEKEIEKEIKALL